MQARKGAAKARKFEFRKELGRNEKTPLNEAHAKGKPLQRGLGKGRIKPQP